MTGATTTTGGGGGGGGAFLPHPAAPAAAQRTLRPRTSSRFIPRLLDLESERWGLPGKPRPSARPLAHADTPLRGVSGVLPERRKDLRTRRMLAQTAIRREAFQERDRRRRGRLPLPAARDAAFERRAT